MHRYGLATILEELSDGYEFYTDNWPLHITQVDTFEVRLDPPELSLYLENLISQTHRFKINTLNDELFGPDKNIPVTRLGLTKHMLELHNSIISNLVDLGATFKRPYILKENYKPHVTLLKEKRIDNYSIIKINSISLIDKQFEGESNKRRIYKTFMFKKSITFSNTVHQTGI